MAKKNKKEGAIGKALRTWSPGKYIGKFIKGESIGVSEKTAKQRAKKASEKKASKKAETTKRTEAHKKSVAKKDKGTGGKNWYPGKYAKKFIKGEPIGVPKSKKKADAKKAADKSWKKASTSAKKAGGPSISTLVKSRGMHKKGSSEWKSIQNKINEHYGSSKRYEKGGKVEASGGDGGGSNPYGWPSRDARNGGKK